MKTIVVTGGAGFLGSHLTRKLVELGHRVIVIDNLITTGDPKYIKDLIVDEKIKFIRKDICDEDLIMVLAGILEEFEIKDNDGKVTKIDEIFNLASPASVRLYTRFPELTFLTSTKGVLNMLNIAKVLGTKDVRFLETSTSEVYGDPLVHPQWESYFGNVNTQCNRSCYDEGKRGAEVLCYLHSKKMAGEISGINVHIARLFNVYGPNNTDDRVMPTFITQAMHGADITVYGDGEQTRSFCFVDDLIDGLLKLQASNISSPVNLGNPQEIKIIELAQLINSMFGDMSKITFHPLPEFDPTRRCPDISLAKSKLGWEPKISLRDGILKVIKWMEKEYGYGDSDE